MKSKNKVKFTKKKQSNEERLTSIVNTFNECLEAFKKASKGAKFPKSKVI